MNKEDKQQPAVAAKVEWHQVKITIFVQDS
jgi:hypothetical protein